MSLARVIMRGLFLKERFAVYGIQKASRSFGKSTSGAKAALDDGMAIGSLIGVGPRAAGNVPP